MARRRMISLDVIDRDEFGELSIEARYLYIEMTVRADDHGFFTGIRRLLKITGCTRENLEELKEKGFVLSFESGAYLIVDWLIANRIQPSRIQPTIFSQEMMKVRIVNGRYELVNLQTEE